MDYRKILVSSAVICSFFAVNLQTFADEPILVHPARQDIFGGSSSSSAKKSASPKTSTNKIKKEKRVKIKRHISRKRIVKIKQKPKAIVINFDSIDKMIENNDFANADRLLRIAISQKNKNLLRAQSLQAVSWARQGKLGAAQNQLNKLLKINPKNSDLHYAQGVVYYKSISNMSYKGQMSTMLSKAEDEFRTSTLLDKTNYMAFNALGVALLKDGSYKDARSAFSKALALNPKYSTALDNLGTMDYADGKINDARKKFMQSIVINPDNATALYHLAKIESDSGNYKKALGYLSRAIALKPNFSPNTNLLGEILKKQGNDAAAINTFKKAISQNPQNVLSYYNLASLYERRGDGELAMSELKNAISASPDYPILRLKLADISIETGKYDQAIENYSLVVGDKKLNAQALKGLANAYYDKAQSLATKSEFGSNKDLFNALDCINEAIKMDSNDLELHLAKLKLAKITNQPTLSDSLLKEIINSPANDLGSKITKGEAYLTLNDYNKAQTIFNDAINSTKSTDESLRLAEIFTYHKQYECARKVLQNVLKTDSTNPEALSSLDYISKCEKYANSDFENGNYYLRKKNIPAAIEYFNRSLSLNPNNAQAHLILAQLYEKRKDYPNAITNYKAYLGLTNGKRGARSLQRKINRLNKNL